MSFEASLKALHDDAKIWNDIADTTSEATKATSDLRLNECEMSFASRSTGLLDTYEAVRAEVERLLGEATTNFRDIRDALETVAYAYEISDEFGSRRMKGAWDPKR